MKLKNLFKKTEKSVVKSNFQKLDQNQVKKIVGGTGIVDSTEPSIDDDLEAKAKGIHDKVKGSANT